MKRFIGVLVSCMFFAAPSFCDTPPDKEKGIEAYRQGDYATALKILLPIAAQGDVEAQYKIGTMYFEGLGIERDQRLAAVWMHKAADQDDPFAQGYLAIQYFYGWGVEKDHSKGIEWALKATEQVRLSPSLHILGHAHQFGKVVEKNYMEAMKYYHEAAEKGSALSQTQLYRIYNQEKNYTEALKWLHKAAMQGRDRAQFQLGLMFYEGLGTLQNFKEAREWLSKAMLQRNSNAMHLMGIIFYNGQGVEQNDVIAHICFNLAAAHGNEAAIELRNEVTRHMTTNQIVEAQRRAMEWMEKYGQAK